MKLIAALILLSMLPCAARLGETEDQCVARYGVDRIIQMAGRAKLVEFKNGDFILLITFWDNFDVFEAIHKPKGEHFSRQEADDIVAQESDLAGWSPPKDDEIVGQTFTIWTGKDSSLQRLAHWNFSEQLGDYQLVLSCLGQKEASEAVAQASAKESTSVPDQPTNAPTFPTAENASAQLKITQITSPPATIAASSIAIGQNVSVTFTDGTVKTGKIFKIDSSSIELQTDNGGGTFFFDSMSKPDQVKFGYTAQNLVKQADEKLAKKLWDSASWDYDAAIKIDPKYADAYLGRGTVKSIKDDLEGAIADFDKAIEINPTLTQAYVSCADAKVKKEDWDGAIADYSKAINLDPKNEFYYGNRGDIESKKKDWDAAISDYDKALELRPNADFFYAVRAFAKVEKKDYAGGIADYTQDIKLSPNDGDAYDNRGVAKSDLKDWDGAIEDYTKAIEIDPKDDFAYSHRAKSKIEKSDVDGAVADDTKAAEIKKLQQAPASTTIQPEPQSDSAGGLSAGAVQVKETERSDEYVHFGWKVPVTNNTSLDATNVSIEISCRSSNDIEIDSFTSNNNAVPRGKTVNVTASTLIEKSLWQQANHWTVRISNFSR